MRERDSEGWEGVSWQLVVKPKGRHHQAVWVRDLVCAVLFLFFCHIVFLISSVVLVYTSLAL